MSCGLPVRFVLQVDLALYQMDAKGLGGCGRAQRVQEAVEQVVHFGPLQEHLQLDEGPVAAQVRKRSRGPVRPYELVVAGVD